MSSYTLDKCRKRDYSTLKLLKTQRKKGDLLRDWLIAMRKKKNLSTKEVATALGISESYYCEIEAGKRQKKMDMVLIAGIAAVLGLPVAEIAIKEKET